MSEDPPVCCSQKQVTISVEQLPLCCPPRDKRIWDAHPRVYLPIVAAKGEVICPYCGVKYILLSNDSPGV